LPELGRPGRVRDRVEHVGVVHGRRTPLVHEVQLDLQAHLRRAGIEHVVVQHPGEDLQRAPYLVPVPAPVFAADLDGLNVTAHEASAQLDRETMYPAGHPPYTLARHRPWRQRAAACARPGPGRAPGWSQVRDPQIEVGPVDAAVDLDDLAGDVAAGRGGEEHHRGRDVSWVADPAERGRPLHL